MGGFAAQLCSYGLNMRGLLNELYSGCHSQKVMETLLRVKRVYNGNSKEK